MGNKGYTMVEILVSLFLLSIFSLTVISVNSHMLETYKAGVGQSVEIKDLEASIEGVYDKELAATVDRRNRKDLDYILRIDGSNTTYTTFLDPEDEYTYRGSETYLRYQIKGFETKQEEAALAPYYIEGYVPYGK